MFGAAAVCFLCLLGLDTSKACCMGKQDAAKASKAKAAREQEVLGGKPAGLGLPVSPAHANSS